MPGRSHTRRPCLGCKDRVQIPRGELADLRRAASHSGTLAALLRDARVEIVHLKAELAVARRNLADALANALASDPEATGKGS